MITSLKRLTPGNSLFAPTQLVKSRSLYNGRLEIQLAPDKTYEVGHKIEMKVMLTSPNAPEGYFSVRFWLEIDALRTKAKTHTDAS